MLHETVQEIQATLRGIEEQETPWVEANFVERVDALDGLSWRILERIENVQYVHAYHTDLAAGLGRVVRRVGLVTGAHVQGVEFAPAYCAYVQQRADRLQLSRATFLDVAARQAAYADGTVFFLFPPFTARMLQGVLAKL